MTIAPKKIEKLALSSISTNQEKRIKIAEFCGWTPSLPEKVYYSRVTLFDKSDLHGVPPGEVYQEFKIGGDNTKPLPDYFNDLNAIQAEERKYITDYSSFIRNLPKYNGAAEICLRATAAERAEAFGLTLGLWETA